MRVDSNTKGHLQWFNFKITNLKENVKYKINICNFQKGKTLFSRGMKPYIFSKMKF
jgi:cytosolic carboxypeptidase protein 2/3